MITYGIIKTSTTGIVDYGKKEQFKRSGHQLLTEDWLIALIINGLVSI